MRYIFAALIILIAPLVAFGQNVPVLTSDQIARLPELPWSKACSTPVRDAQEVSLIQLIAAPERYEGKSVTVIGYFHLGFEHSAMYLSKSDYENDVWINGVWVDSVQPIEINDSYILITGIFTQKHTGHLGGWPSAICNVSELTKWPGHEH